MNIQIERASVFAWIRDNPLRLRKSVIDRRTGIVELTFIDTTAPVAWARVRVPVEVLQNGVQAWVFILEEAGHITGRLRQRRKAISRHRWVK